MYVLFGKRSGCMEVLFSQESNQKLLFTQAIMAQIAQVSRTKISRYISNKKIPEAYNIEKKSRRYSLEVTQNIISNCRVSPEGILEEKVHTFYNFKGGTGKSTMCYHTACLLALMGYKVLCIDLDPQAHLSSSLGFNENSSLPTMYDVLINGMEIMESIKSVFSGLDVIPGNLALTRIEVPLSQKTKREEILDKKIKQTRNQYDYILIDTNPTISTLNLNAIVCSDRLSIVCETQPFSLSGLGLLVDEMQRFSEDMNQKVNYSILANKYEAKTSTSQEVLGVLRSDYKEYMMDSIVRKCEDFNISAKLKMPLILSAPRRSFALEDMIDVTAELIKKSYKMHPSAPLGQ